MNNLDPEVAEKPDELIVMWGGQSRAHWESFDAIVRSLQELENVRHCWCNQASPSESFAHTSCAARADCEFGSRRSVGQLGIFP